MVDACWNLKEQAEMELLNTGRKVGENYVMHLFQAKVDEGATSGKEGDAEAHFQGLVQVLGTERMQALLKFTIMKVIFEMFMDQMEVLPVFSTWQLLDIGVISFFHNL